MYQSALTYQLRKLGYEIEPGQSGAPEIKGYSQEYLDASSPRSQQIKEQMERAGFQGPEAAQIAAHSTRDRKQTLKPEEVLAAHKEMAAEYGNQPERIIAAARERALSQQHGTGAAVGLREAQSPSPRRRFSSGKPSQTNESSCARHCAEAWAR